MNDTQPTTRDESLRGLVVEGGRIRSPGKYEGEPVYVPFFWEKALDGWADDQDKDGGVIFIVMPEERRAWPELGSKRVIGLREDDQGFVREFDVSPGRECLVLELLK